MFQAADGRSAEGTKDVRLIPETAIGHFCLFPWQKPSPVVTTSDPLALEMQSKKFRYSDSIVDSVTLFHLRDKIFKRNSTL